MVLPQDQRREQKDERQEDPDQAAKDEVDEDFSHNGLRLRRGSPLVLISLEQDKIGRLSG